MPDPKAVMDVFNAADDNDTLGVIRQRIAAMGIDTSEPLDFDAVDREIAADWRAEQTRIRKAAWIAQVPAEFADASLDLVDDVDVSNALRAWLPTHDRNVLLTGTTGVGKTFAAYATARAAWDLNVRSHVVTATELLQEFRPAGDAATQKKILDVDLLFLDEMGPENDTPWTDETWNRIVDHRYRNRKPIIVTTNLASSADLTAKYGNRVVSRLLSNHALIVRMTGPDRRARF